MSGNTTRKPTQTKTAPRRDRSEEDSPPRAIPGLVLAWSSPRVKAGDRAPIHGRFIVGRGSSSTWRIYDDLLSREHFEIVGNQGRHVIRDLGSRNGTFLDGSRVIEPRMISPGGVIRAGACVFLVIDDLSAVAQPGEKSSPGLAGRFHSPTIVRRLRVASHTGRHVLLEGESGTGKELAANILHSFYEESGHKGPLIVQNGACFADESDAVASLFGVAQGGFTGVNQRSGAAELAIGGTLFIDEFHNLPIRVQRSLLRFVEDGMITRLGGTKSEKVDVRIIFGTNHNVTCAVRDKVLAHDLVARLHRVNIKPLRDRRADIPDIFREILRKAGPREIVANIDEKLDEELIEQLVVRNFRDGNVRELEDLAALLVARVAEGDRPQSVLFEALGRADLRPGPQPSPAVTDGSTYEIHRQEIINGYYTVNGNLTQLEHLMHDRGIPCSRRWLSTYLDRWDIRKARRRG